MSYPSQPQYTPPYGQPPQRQGNNLWLIGGSVIAVLAIIMTVTLILVQQTAGSNEAGGGGETEDPSESEEATEEEPTAEESTEDDSDGGDDSGDDGGSLFSEATCDTYDLAGIEELFGDPADHPDGTTISADTYDNTGYLSCYYTTTDYDSLTVTVNGFGSADSAMDTYEFDYDYWNDAEDYEVTAFDQVGEAGYHSVYGSTGSQLREIEFVIGKIVFSVEVWIYVEEHDPGKADDILADFGQQAADIFVDHT